VARTQPRREHYGCLHLRNQGFASLCPVIEQAAREGMRDVPMFPGYVFVKLDLERDSWRSVNGTRGIAGLVSFGLRPAPLPPELASLLDRISEGSGRWSAEDHFRRGDEVRIVGGAFDGTIGEFVEQKGAARVAILIEMLARPHEVVVHSHSLVRT
jgi:transcription elongation factor/antiterminator RfaH